MSKTILIPSRLTGCILKQLGNHQLCKDAREALLAAIKDNHGEEFIPVTSNSPAVFNRIEYCVLVAHETESGVTCAFG